MKKLVLNIPTLAFIAATRGMLGVGIGLLVSQRLPSDRRRSVGMTLAAIGAAATVPALFAVIRGRKAAQRLPIPAAVV
jgi:hypothetical protein